MPCWTTRATRLLKARERVQPPVASGSPRWPTASVLRAKCQQHPPRGRRVPLLARSAQQRIRLIESPANAFYAPPTGKHPGYLLWRRESTLVAQPLDPASARFSGEVVTVKDERMAVPVALQQAEFSVSTQGTLAFQGGDFSVDLVEPRG